jgi:hypothetical protein
MSGARLAFALVLKGKFVDVHALLELLAFGMNLASMHLSADLQCELHWFNFMV